MKLSIIVLILFTFQNALAQVKEEIIYSQILNEDRRIQIGLPDSYEANDNEKFPLIFLTDGEWHFDMIYQATKLIYQNGGPKLMVIGIPNTNRTRDLTISKSEEDISSGGANDFIQFLEEELIPYLEINYRVSNHRTLLGHSAGGLFATYTMLSKPSLFNAFVAVTPTIRWDNYNILDRFENKKPEEIIDTSVQFHLSIGNETGIERLGVLKLDSIYSSISLKEYSFIEYPNLSHITVPWNAYFDALNGIFDKFYVSEEILNESLNNIKIYFNSLGEQFDYDMKIPQRILLNRGYALLTKNKLKEALENFQHYADSYPDVPIPYSNLGDIYVQLAQYEEAKKCYERAYQLYPTNYVESKLKELTNNGY